MNPFPTFTHLFIADAASVPRTWKLAHEGLEPGWAFLIFLTLGTATALAYQKCAPGVGNVRNLVMTTLRLLSAALFAALATKPVIRFTEYHPVKQPLAVLVDGSRSMGLADRRDNVIDRNRAAIAAGLLKPDADLNVPPSATIAEKASKLTRRDLLFHLGGNREMDLWTRLESTSNLRFYQFGSGLKPLGSPEMTGDAKKSSVRFPTITAEDASTSIGEALRQVIQEPRDRKLGAVILVTDGGNNNGSSPIEAAQIAREQNVPLFIYGVGVTSPPDIVVSEVTAQPLALVGERLEVRAKIQSRGLDEKPAAVELLANGEVVTKIEVPLGSDRTEEVALSFIPAQPGEVKLEVNVPVRDGEVGSDNNHAAATARITDRKFNVLLVEQEPRWDFRFLLDYLQRDQRLIVHSVMIDGEPGLSNKQDSPFLPALPNTRESLFESQVIILGDVSPKDLGHERMEMIVEWVEAGGGIIFLAGPKFNPVSYTGTPLEALLPVVPDISRPRAARIQREAAAFPLELTATGRRSPYLQMDADPKENQRIWQSFPGVRWVAPVARAKPGAEELLTDARSSSAGRNGKPPVFAMQGYGSGKCVYFGTDETYRWRSRTGEKYYSILWGQIMQTLALQLLDGASPLTQLRTDRKQYLVGERVVISGNAYEGNYEPLIVPSLEASLARVSPGETTPSAARSLHLTATGRNFYRTDFVATDPGTYAFHTTHDPEGVLRFEVIKPDLEGAQTALDDRLLKNMAATAGGRFLREEDLHKLPDWISATSLRVESYRTVALYHSAWILTALCALLFAEWTLRRLSRLK